MLRRLALTLLGLALAAGMARAQTSLTDAMDPTAPLTDPISSTDGTTTDTTGTAIPPSPATEPAPPTATTDPSANTPPAAPDGAFAALSRGNQVIARALFEAQTTNGDATVPALSLDAIAAMRQSGRGWGKIFHQLKAEGVVEAKTLGGLVSGHYRPRLGATSPAAARPTDSGAAGTTSTPAQMGAAPDAGRSPRSLGVVGSGLDTRRQTGFAGSALSGRQGTPAPIPTLGSTAAGAGVRPGPPPVSGRTRTGGGPGGHGRGRR